MKAYLSAFCLSLSILRFASAEIEYSITDLGTLGGENSQANAINNLGQVVGNSLITDNTLIHGYIYSVNEDGWGTIQDIGTFPNGTDSRALGLNASGRIVGYCVVNNMGDTRAFSRSVVNNASVLTDLGTLGGTSSEAMGINDLGIIVGSSTTQPNNLSHAFRCQIINNAPVMVDLGTLVPGGTSYATAINASGEIVGRASNNAGDLRAFRYSTVNGIGTMSDLGTLSGGTSSQATAINNFGVVIGHSNISNAPFPYHAFRHTIINGNSQMVDLGTLPGNVHSEAYAINSANVIVGLSSDGNFNLAVRWTPVNGVNVIADLNTLIRPNSGWLLRSAKGINDAGQIVGEGMLYLQSHSFLLTPIRPPSSPSLSAPILLVKGKKKVITTKSNLTIKGTAIGSITKVSYKIGSRTKTATGTNIWKFKAPLKPGKNKITINAQGPGGISTPAKVTVTRK